MTIERVGRGMLRWSGLAVATLAVAFSAGAAVGPPPLLERGAVDLGAEVGTLERDLEIRGTVGGAAIQPRVLNSSQTTINLRGAYALTDNLQARVLLGAGWINLGQFDWSNGLVGLGRQDMDGEAGLLWGLGGAYVVSPLATAPDVRVGLSGEYRHYTSEVDRGEIEMDEFRVALQVAWPMDRITLYGGPVYSDVRGSFSGSTSLGFRSNGDLDAEERIGVLAGAEYQFSPRLAGRIEGEFVSSTAVNLSVIYGLGGPAERAPQRVATAPPPARASEDAYVPAAPETDWGAPPPPRRRAGAEPAASSTPPASTERTAAPPEGEGRRPKPPTPPAGTRPRGGAAPSGSPAATAPAVTAPAATAPAATAPAAREQRVVPAAELRGSENLETLLAAGAEAAGLGRYDEAITYYRRAVAADRGEFRAVYNLATAQYLARDYAGAQASYEAAISLRPGDAESHLFLGFCHYRQRRPEAAGRAWRRVLEIDPSNAIALNNLQALGY